MNVPMPDKPSIDEMDWSKMLEYRDGKLYWKHTRGATAKAGDEAGYVDERGYRCINLMLGGKLRKYRAHRIVVSMHGEVVANRQIDHINGNTLDNRIENLRFTTHSLNRLNHHAPSTKGASRFVGVHRNKRGTWVAQLMVNGRCVFSKTYKTELEAKRAYDVARATAMGVVSQYETTQKL